MLHQKIQIQDPLDQNLPVSIFSAVNQRNFLTVPHLDKVQLPLSYSHTPPNLGKWAEPIILYLVSFFWKAPEGQLLGWHLQVQILNWVYQVEHQAWNLTADWLKKKKKLKEYKNWIKTMRNSYANYNAAAHLFHLKRLERSRNPENLTAEPQCICHQHSQTGCQVKILLAECYLFVRLQSLLTTISQVFRRQKTIQFISDQWKKCRTMKSQTPAFLNTRWTDN